MLEVLPKIFGSFVLILVGYLAKRASLISPQASKIFSTIFFNISLPFTIVSAFLSVKFDRELIALPFVSFLVIIFILIVSILISRKLPSGYRHLYIVCLPSYGLGSFALPFLQNIYGALAVIIVVIFDLGNILVSAGGSYCAANICTSKTKVRLIDNIKYIIKSAFVSPPFIVSVIMFVLVLSGVELPKTAILDLINPIADANAFIALFTVGLLIDFDMDKSSRKISIAIALAKVVLNIIIALVLFYFAPFNLEVRKILVIVAMSPIGQLTIFFIEKLKGDMKAVAFINTLSIMISFVIMAICVLLFTAS